jgi:FkbM family methyltransferase
VDDHIGHIEQLALTVVSAVLTVLPPRCRRRVAGIYFNRRHFAAGQLLPRRMADGTRLMLDIGDPMQASALLGRRWAPKIVAFALANLPRGGTFVDVGANVGLISLPIARRRPDATVIGFEPHPTNIRMWETNCALNSLPNARLEPLGLGDHSGPSAMAVPGDLGAGYITESGDIPVVMTTLDSYAADHGIERIDVVKIDAEGGEPQVLDGASRLLDSGAIRCIIIEINDLALARSGLNGAAVVDRLTGYGYVLTPMGPLPANPGLGPSPVGVM